MAEGYQEEAYIVYNSALKDALKNNNGECFKRSVIDSDISSKVPKLTELETIGTLGKISDAKAQLHTFGNIH